MQPGTGKAAAFFDLDKTIIAASSTLAFGRSFYQGGLVNRRALIKSAYAQMVYLLAGADTDQMDRMRDALAGLCAGWPVEQVRTIVSETLHELIDPLVYSEAVALIEEHRSAGRDVVIVSSSGEEVVRPIGEMLGVPEVIATQMEVVEGRYTGAVSFYAFAEGKATAIRELAERRGYDLSASFAYSDSVTDLPMLHLVGHPTVVNPDRALRRTAEEQGWPVLNFRRPVRLADRIPRIGTHPSPLLTGVAAGAAGVTAGLVWWARRREVGHDPAARVAAGSPARALGGARRSA